MAPNSWYFVDPSWGVKLLDTFAMTINGLKIHLFKVLKLHIIYLWKNI